MSALWTAREIARATGGAVHGDFAATGVTFDSREVAPGDLFIALKGEATDGHRFLDQAYAAGASGAVVSADETRPHVRVADGMAALEALGTAARQRTEARIAGVTGSVGKTGTKEALRLALERGAPGCVHASVKSYNNHTGVPLSLARMPAESLYGVFEMGMNHAGELAGLTRLVRPHVAIVTAIAPAHRAYFDSDEAIADAKGEIFQGLEPGGTAIIPFDSPHRDRLIAAAKPYAANIVTFGRTAGADVRAKDAAAAQGGGSLVVATLPGAVNLTFTIGMAGSHWVSNGLAVIAAVQALNGDLAAAGLALAGLTGLTGRGERREVMLPGGSATLIDESYNANPVSMAAALSVLGVTAGRRIAVLGGMRELGSESDAFHAGLAAPIAAAGVAHALLVGDEMMPLAQALAGKIAFDHVADAGEALQALRDMLAPGDVILIKGSNAIGLGRLVTALTGGDG